LHHSCDFLPHEKKSQQRQEEEGKKVELHAIVKQEHETGWVLWEIFARFALSGSFSPSHSLVFCATFFMLPLFVVVAFFVFVAIDISSTLLENTLPEGQGRKLRVISLSASRLCWYVQKKEQNTFRNEIAQEHVQWGKIFLRRFFEENFSRLLFDCT
jgi:hypothetical protein